MERQRLSEGASDDEQDALLAEVLEEAIEAGQRAVERTPEQLDVLAEAGVVDAGAYGLVLILSGIVAGLRGDEAEAPQVARYEPPRHTRPHHEDSRFRYCTNFIVTGAGLDSRSLVPDLEQIGDSVLVVGDEATLKVHVHTDEPDRAVALFEAVGEVQRLDVGDMREQIAARERRLQPARTGIVAVAAGAGVRRLYEDLGAHVIEAGEKFNPSTYEILAGIHELPAEGVLVLPNSPNVRLAAERAAELSERPAWVVDSASPQAGLVAIVELDPDGSMEENAPRLESALSEVRVGAVAPAARDDARGRFVQGDAVGFVGEELVAWGGAGSTLTAVIAELAAGAEIVTVIGGDGAPFAPDAILAHAPPGVEVEVHEGGQPHWWWLLAAQ
jgi:hypothetical protein